MGKAVAGSRGVRVALLATIALSALLLSIAAMHASMVRAHGPVGHQHAVSAEASAMASPDVPMAGTPGSDGPMGDMDLADCLLMGMACLLAAAAVLILGLLTDRMRSVLRPRVSAQALGAVLRRFQPLRPPSLLTLSISRT